LSRSAETILLQPETLEETKKVMKDLPLIKVDMNRLTALLPCLVTPGSMPPALFTTLSDVESNTVKSLPTTLIAMISFHGYLSSKQNFLTCKQVIA